MKIAWTSEQLDVINKWPLPYDVTGDMSDDVLAEFYEEIPEHLDFSNNGEPTGDCDIVEDILTRTSGAMNERKLLAGQELEREALERREALNGEPNSY